METRSFTSIRDLPRLSACGTGTLVLVFGAAALGDDSEPFASIRAAFASDDSVIVGCSTSGQVLDGAVSDAGFVGLAVRFRHSRVRLASTLVESAACSRDAGRRLAADLDADDLAVVLLLSDGILVDGSELVSGLSAGLRPGVAIAGGMAGDDAQFSRTWVLAGDQLSTGIVAAVGIYGDRVHLASGSKGGWERFGPVRKVTRSVGSRLYEIDAKPALDLYKSYLGMYATNLPSSALLFPLAVQPSDRSRYVVRTILAVDESDQSMTFAGAIPEGSTVQLMRASPDMLIDGAMQAAEECNVQLAEAGHEDLAANSFALAVSCVGRRLALGERVDEELEAVRNVLSTVPMVGFYSNGEVCPRDGWSELQNQTMTLAVLSERVGA